MPEEKRTIRYEIEEHIGDISEDGKGWSKELNLISWNDRKPKYDIRSWSADHGKMGKGISMSEKEARRLYELLKEKFGDSEK